MKRNPQARMRRLLLLNLAGSTCTFCGKGRLAAKVVTYDLGPLLGMPKVKVENMPALVCSECEEVTVTGPVIDGVATLLTATILGTPEMAGPEVRYLRKLLGDTQDEFAEKLQVDRVTVNRWENSMDPLPGISSEAVRLHSYLRLRGRSTQIDAVGALLTAKRSPESRRDRGRRSSYALDGSHIRQSLAA
jgi:YgiT-type zinc finger domain-containing protein